MELVVYRPRRLAGHADRDADDDQHHPHQRPKRPLRLLSQAHGRYGGEDERQGIAHGYRGRDVCGRGKQRRFGSVSVTDKSELGQLSRAECFKTPCASNRLVAVEAGLTACIATFVIRVVGSWGVVRHGRRFVILFLPHTFLAVEHVVVKCVLRSFVLALNQLEFTQIVGCSTTVTIPWELSRK